ncbi:hypothetical protein [Candidatus Burkholderia verschuerenii]|uniref:hypothetical protein n=1 Tax=Candidatus Burkholderia verschuerenii TaxID=242163 RepID=UPI0012ED94D8|nr:hypothetical protein [Candidatus Burkholderia verschuerenii]
MGDKNREFERKHNGLIRKAMRKPPSGINRIIDLKAHGDTIPARRIAPARFQAI